MKYVGCHIIAIVFHHQAVICTQDYYVGDDNLTLFKYFNKLDEQKIKFSTSFCPFVMRTIMKSSKFYYTIEFQSTGCTEYNEKENCYMGTGREENLIWSCA